MNDLRIRLYWIMGLRMAFVTLMLGLSLAFQVGKGGRVETFYTLIIVTYILTIPSAILLRALTHRQLSRYFFGLRWGSTSSLKRCWLLGQGGSKVPSRCCMS